MTPEAGSFLAPGAKLEQLGRCYVPNIKAIGLQVSDKEIFSYLYISLCKTCNPRSGPFLAQGG